MGEFGEKLKKLSEAEALALCVKAKTDFELETCFKLIPQNFKNKDFYLKMVKTNGSLLFFIPEEYITEEIIFSAIKNDGEVLRVLDKAEQTPEICIQALNQSEKAYVYVKITKNPDHQTTINNLKKIMVDKNKLIIKNTIQGLSSEK